MKSIIDRRTLLSHSLLGASATLLGKSFIAPAFAQTGSISLQDINESTAVYRSSGTNVLVKKASNGELLIIDGGLEANATSLLTSITGSMDSTNITTLVNTHWHREQTGLNQILGDRGVEIFAHENTRQWLSVEIERPWEQTTFSPLARAAQPNETFVYYGDRLHGGEVEVLYGYLRQAHTDGDMYVFFPQDNILHTGGAVSNDGWPLMDWWTGGWIGGLVDSLETLLSIANEQTIIVPSSGPVMTRAELIEMRDMYAGIFTGVRDLFMAAQTPQETIDAKPAGAFEGRFGNSDAFILLAHQSVLAHYAPDA